MALKTPQKETKNLQMRREVAARAEAQYQNRVRVDLIAKLKAEEDVAFKAYCKLENAITRAAWLAARDALREAKRS